MVGAAVPAATVTADIVTTPLMIVGEAMEGPTAASLGGVAEVAMI